MRRVVRLAWQIGLLPLLYLASLPDPALFTVVIVVALCVAPAVNVTVAAILVWTARQAPDIPTLVERADDAVTLALMSLGAAAVALVSVAVRSGFDVPRQLIVAVLAWVLLLISVPALGWLRTWRDIWLPAAHKVTDA